MVRIPAATFRMGTDISKVSEIAAQFNIQNHPDLIQAETPQHAVTIDSFWLDRFEVTNAAFQKFIRARPEWSATRIPRQLNNGNYLNDWIGKNFPVGQANHPVVNVTWYAAFAFCEWSGKRLPTEAEWEFAARGGLQGRTFPWGNDLVDSSRANYRGSDLNAPTAVGSYPANGYGLFDMAGNVWEFVADEWGPYSDSPQVNPVAGDFVPFFVPFKQAKGSASPMTFPGVTTRRVIRGGSFAGAPLNLRVTYRDSHPPDGAQPFVGFRCARSF